MFKTAKRLHLFGNLMVIVWRSMRNADSEFLNISIHFVYNKNKNSYNLYGISGRRKNNMVTK